MLQHYDAQIQYTHWPSPCSHTLQQDLSYLSTCCQILCFCAQSEKELQSGGEIKELVDVADSLSKRLVKDTTAWTNKKEILQADQIACQQVQPALT